MGQNRDLKTSSLSLTTSNHLGKIATDLAALMTDVKPFWDFRTYNPRLEKYAEIFGKLSSAWYLQRGIDTRFSECIKYWEAADRKSTRLNSSHVRISYAVFCLKKKNETNSSIKQYIQKTTRMKHYRNHHSN